jgi:phage shock protein C
MKAYRRGVYRSRNGAIFGVCRGLAEYFDFSVFWVRFIAVALLLLTGLWPAMVLYILAALVMKKEPAIPVSSVDEQMFYDDLSQSRHAATRRLKRRYEGLDNRIRRMEDIVTSREYDWERRFRT